MLHLVIYHVRSAVFTRFLISRGADVFVTLKDAHFRRWPLIQGGLEIPVEVTVRMEACTKNVEAIKGLIN